jgi:transcriptional antiterminator
MTTELCSIRTLAQKFHCSTETIRRKVKAGELPGPILGDIHSKGLKIWNFDDVLAYLARRRAEKESLEQRLLKRAI